MKVNIFKSTIIFFLGGVILLILIVLFDLAKYDSSYINRSPLTFDVNNLNSKKTKKLFRYYENLYHEIAFKISKDHKDYWEIEDPSLRANSPEKKIISKKKENFLPGKKIEEIEKNFSNWPRSHGGFSSNRFWHSGVGYPNKGDKYFKVYRNFFIKKLKENEIEVVYTIKPLWGEDADNVLKPILDENCVKKTAITDILDSHLILKCDDLKN